MNPSLPPPATPAIIPMRTLALTTFALVGFLGQSPSLAQAGARDVSFRVLCLEHTRDILEAQAPAPNGGTVEVSLFTGGFGPQLKARFPSDKAVLFIQEDPADPATRRMVAEGTLVDSPMQLLLLVPNPDSAATPYRILAFDDREGAFPMGGTRVINFAALPIRLTLANAEMKPVPPGGNQVYPMVRVADEWNMFPATLSFGLPDGRWVEAATQSWKASDRKRDWVIVNLDPATRSPEIRLYQDIPPWLDAPLPTEAP